MKRTETWAVTPTDIAALESQNECRFATSCGVLHLKLDFSGGSLVHGQKLDRSFKAGNDLHHGSLDNVLALAHRAKEERNYCKSKGDKVPHQC